MGLGSSRSVEIQICNNTQNITMKKPRTSFGHGCCSKYPRPQLSPGSSDTCSFWGDPQLWGVVGTTAVSGILVYEAESFTLAIHFSSPSHHPYFPMSLGLELSPCKAHLSDLEATYKRMASGTYSKSNQDIKFTRVTVAGSHGSTQLSHGPIKVRATVSKTTSSTIKVVLEEKKGSGEKAWGRNPWDVWGDESTSSENQYDRLFPRIALKSLLDGLPASPLLRRRL